MKRFIIAVAIVGTLGMSTIKAQGGASGSWGDNPWYQLNDMFGEAYNWFVYIMGYPLISWDTWNCDDNGCD